MKEKPKWDWTRPEMQAHLQVGTILMECARDCGVFCVNEITPEGVIMPVFIFGEELFTWERLNSMECIIYKQPEPGQPLPDVGPRLMERGGRFSNAELADVDLSRSPESGPDDAFPDAAADRGAVAALIRLIPDGASVETISAVASAADGGMLEVDVIAIDERGQQTALTATDELLRMLDYAAPAEVRRPLTKAVLRVEAVAGGTWRYGFDFEYD